MRKIVLCADSDSLAHPELMGLEDVNLDTVPWLGCFSQATEVREKLKSGLEADEVWIVSSDDVEAINLLAALRKDHPDMTLLLVVQNATGSILSRAQNAGANGTLTTKGFTERFTLENLRRARMEEAAFADEEILLDDIKQSDVERAKSAAEARKFSGAAAKTTPLERVEVEVEVPQAIPTPAPSSQAPSATNLRMRAERGSGQAFVLTVLSGSGGAGKSTVAAISAALSAARGHNTLLMDCDLQFGDMHRLMGEDAPLTLDDVLEDPDKLESLATGGAGAARGVGKARGAGGVDGADGCGPHLLAAPKRLEQSEVVGQYLPRILDTASGLFDVIVVNTGANWADYHAVLLERSECSLLLVDQRASSVRACQHALELCSRLGVASGSFSYAVNHCERGALFTSLDVAFVMHGAHVYELKEGGSAVEEMLGAGQLQDLLASKNSLCESVDSMLDEILPERQAKDKGHKRTGRRKKALDDLLDGSEGLDAGSFAGAPSLSAAGTSRKHSSRRRGRAAKAADIPAIEEKSLPLAAAYEERVPESWR